ncbi:MAG TPA: hypothetical protein DDZ80_00700 [Cyanobacteria bacterium UBA8803]|nr:hypothetical protein [Cyanobacteria bacterium UBA9273]HBL57129.1 hypothetical protein [Cyanobacteria bacterium UBA8803]
MKWYHTFTLPLIFFLSGSNTPAAQVIDNAALSGDIRLTLKRGLWMPHQEERVYQDITLDLVCESARCEQEVWGFAPTFNQGDHQGTVEAIASDEPKRLWPLQVKITTSPDPWMRLVGEANYDIQLRLHQNQLIGTYAGTFANQPVSGEVNGTIRPHWPRQLPNHRPIRAREHPRLIFRPHQLPALREKAKTSTGQAILAQLQKSLTSQIYYDGYGPNAGSHAAGHCFLALLNGEEQRAETAWQLVVNSINQPRPRLLEQSSVVAGVALAYDLCYNNWNEQRLRKVTRWLGEQTASLIKGTPDRGWNPQPQSNWNARARGSAGLAALAIWAEPDEFLVGELEESPPSQPNLRRTRRELHSLLKIAERNIKRYMSVAIGEHGFGTEGDLYTRESFHAILPFLQAYQNVLGKDLVQGSSGEWFLAHYVMRMVSQGGQVALPTYGRHRIGPDGSLFALGLATVPERFLPGVLWCFNRYFGWQGDRRFGVGEYTPHDAAFALAGYREDIIPQNPGEILDRIVVDEQKGFYAFRNQWQGDRDFVASIYLKREPLGQSWSFPDAGSFRIWGLGGRWADAGPATGKQEDENVVLAKEKQAYQGAQPIFFQAESDGSGVVSLQRYNWQRSFGVDYSGLSGTPGLFVVVDRFVGEDKPTNKTWLMHIDGELAIDGQRFTVQAASGATMQGTFVAPQKVRLTSEKSQVGRVLRASGSDRFFVVMTVQQGTPPQVEVLGNGWDGQVKVGEQILEYRGDRIIFSGK